MDDNNPLKHAEKALERIKKGAFLTVSLLSNNRISIKRNI